MGTYTAHVYGTWSHKAANFRYQKEEVLLDVGFRDLNLNLDSLLALDGGFKFAYFNVIDMYGLDWRFQLRKSRWLIVLNLGQASGEVKGVIQAWPFLHGLYRFLGERRHIVLTGRVSWSYLMLGLPIKSQGVFRMTGELSHLRINPDLRYKTWRPLFMGMGADDMRNGGFDIIHASLLRLCLKPDIVFRHWQLSVEVAQWLPISVDKLASLERESGETTDSGN
ncbi:MAG: hypothetical protein KAT58_05895, partial [candidate division Zixibacteria bacterium]|nr:hypothetical protein [candidate division Zixibacteria bacterium]